MIQRVRSPLIGTANITGNLIAASAVSGNNITVDAIRGNNIVAGTITGNLIAVSAVSSNSLASNLNISLSRVLEQANVNTLGIGGNVNIDVANNTLYYFNANTTANVTFNFRANTQNTFDSITTIGQAMTVAIALKHGSTRHTANLYIDGALQTLYYVGNTRPGSASITNQEINLFSYSVFKTAANSYTVITGNSIFGLG
jgi:hypothetical protein